MTTGLDNKELVDPGRLDALHRLAILDTVPEREFDEVASLAASVTGLPVAVVGLMAGERHWFKARIGFEPHEVGLDQSICNRVLDRSGVVVVPDLAADDRTRDLTRVAGEPHLRFYAGLRVESPDGFWVGTLCVVGEDARPDGLDAGQTASLEALGRQVTTLFRLREALGRAERRSLRNEQVLGERRAQFEALVESAGSLSFMARPDGRLYWYNRAWYDFTGTTAVSALGWGWRDVHNPTSREAVEGDVARRIAAGEAWEDTYHLRSASGRYHPFLTRVVPIRDEAGTLVRWVGTMCDVSALHDERDALRARNAELEARLGLAPGGAVSQARSDVEPARGGRLIEALAGVERLASRLSRGRAGGDHGFG